MDLSRFVTAQAPIHAQVMEELRAGRKRSHWMWFVFPQIAGLGRSEMARRYAIADLAEARAYLAHPLLGRRLLECTRLVGSAQGGAEDIMGDTDAMKLRSSMTLFEAAAERDEDASGFAAILERFFAGTRDPATLARI